MYWISRLYETIAGLTDKIWSLGLGKGFVVGGIAAILVLSMIFSRRGPWS